MTSPIDKFFQLGDKVTKGDIKRKADFDYYLLWVMFIAFFTVFLGNMIDFFKYWKLANIGWAAVMIAILWFQYGGLKGAYEMRKMIKDPELNKAKEYESEKDMIDAFKKEI